MHSIRPQAGVFRASAMSATALTLLTSIFSLLPIPVLAQIPTPIVVYNFQGTSDDIYEPTGLLAQGRDGYLYGTGQERAEFGRGGVYKYNPSTRKETLVVSFPATWGACQGLTLGLDGNFYGTCEVGGANNRGFVFQMTPTGALADIYNFTGDDNDANPSTVPVLGANGDLYGTSGATNAACGSIYRVTTKGVYLNVKSGTGYCTPSMLSAGSDGNFYGAWGNDPAYGNRGSVFKVTGAGSYSTVHGFTSTDPSEYPWGVILASNGKLYGADNGEGADGNGAIFDLTTAGKLTDLYNINSAADGALNFNNLFQASNGNFYGASYSGGTDNGGSFYELTSANVFSVIPLGPETTKFGAAPLTPLMQHTDGTLYATTSSNGPGGEGALLSFEIAASPFIALVGPVPAAAEGSVVQILGEGFDSASKVEFGGTAATKVEVTGSTFVEATVPANALTGKITVTTGTTTLSTLANFRILPTLKSFSPSSGAVGSTVVITGTGLKQTTAVKFNGTSAVFTVKSDSQISTTAPTGATTGKITITTKGGAASSSTDFTVD